MNWPFFVDEVDDDWPDPDVWEPIGDGLARGLTAYMLPRAGRSCSPAPRWRSCVGEARSTSSERHRSAGSALRSAPRAGPSERSSSRATAKTYVTPRRTRTSSRSSRATSVRRSAGSGDRGDAAAERRARADQRSPARPRREARHAGDVRPGGRQDPGDLRRPGRRHRRSSTTRRGDPFPVHDRARRPLPGRAHAEHRGPRGRARDPRAACSSTRTSPDATRGRGQTAVHPGRGGASSSCSCRSIVGDEGRGRISLQNLDREDAFSESDVRLLTTLAASLSVALENARLFDETAARRERRAGADQRRPAGPRREPRHAGDVRPRRRPDPGDLRCAGRRHRDPRPGDGLVHFPYSIERGVRLPGRADPAARLPQDASSRRGSRGDQRGRARATGVRGGQQSSSRGSRRNPCVSRR